MRTGSHPTTTKSQNCVRSLGGKGVQVVVWPREAVLPNPTLRPSSLDPSNYLLRHSRSDCKCFSDIHLPTSHLLHQNPINFWNGDAVISDPATKNELGAEMKKTLAKARA